MKVESLADGTKGDLTKFEAIKMVSSFTHFHKCVHLGEALGIGAWDREANPWLKFNFLKGLHL